MDDAGSKANQTPSGSPGMPWFCGTFCFMCAVFGILAVFLLLSIILVGLKIPVGVEPPSLANLALILYHKIFLPFLLYFAEIFRSLLPWPAFAFLVLSLIAWGPDHGAGIISNIGTLELPGGIKFVGRTPLPKEFQRELGEAARTVDKANKAIEDAYDGVKSFATFLRERHDIPQLVSVLASTIAQQIGQLCPDDFRLTLYVPDFIFNDRLYQFTEYYNKRGERIAGDRAGRAYSIRYGIIGRVWRSGIDEIEGELVPPAELDGVNENIESLIARRWGLTLVEAEHVRQYNSYAAFRLRRADRNVGLLYFDSKSVNAFGNKAALQEAILGLLVDGPLVGKLLEISSEIRDWSGRIQIYRNP